MADTQINTTAQLLSYIYPVGSIYMSTNNVSPATFIGGTWEQIKDRFLLCCGTKYVANTTGGEATHTLSLDEMPEHTHYIAESGGSETYRYYTNLKRNWNAKNGVYDSDADDNWEPGSGVQAVGVSQQHNNMPPYIAVYMWRRVEPAILNNFVLSSSGTSMQYIKSLEVV